MRVPASARDRFFRKVGPRLTLRGAWWWEARQRTVAAFAVGCVVTELSCFGPSPVQTQESERQTLLRVSRALPPDTPDRIIDVALEACGDIDAQQLFTDGLDLIIRGCDL